MELFVLSSLSENQLLSGGLSGLHLLEKNGDELRFLSHSDRGPNHDEIEDKINNVTKRPFVKPDFQPFWVEFTLNRKTKEIKNVQYTFLTLPDGKKMTSLPNQESDELPIDSEGKVLKRDINGIDPEAICFDGEYVWMGEEYGPSLLKFSRGGELLRRFVPEGTYQNSAIFKDALPKVILNRKVNRGFEGIACRNGKIFGILQSPLKKEGEDVRIIEFDPKTETVVNEYLYPVDSLESEKIGDLAFLGDQLLVLEQNSKTGAKGIHKVYGVNLGVTDENGRLKKKLVKDLVEAGYSFAEKVEGLAAIGTKEIAVVNDNDFGVNNSSLQSFLGIFPVDK